MGSPGTKYKHFKNNNRNSPIEMKEKMRKFSPIDEEEMIVIEQVKNELLQEEFDWCLAEYEKSQLDVDWSSIEENDNVICPICQKNNLVLCNNLLTCSYCKSSIVTQKTLTDIKNCILHSLEKHNSECSYEFQFSLVQEIDETHIYLICSNCSEMRIVV